MNKVAAEKIAQEYYNIGVQLAMQNSGLVKEAGLSNKEIIKKLVQLPTAGISAVASIEGMGELLKILPKNLQYDVSEFPLIALPFAAIGGGALAGNHLAGKGVDLAHRGGAKAIDALKKLRT